jgi:DNA-binding NarL/FixJ family response regulator
LRAVSADSDLVASVRATVAAARDHVFAQELDRRNGDTLGATNLTRREFEVLSLVAQGLTNPQIAKRLQISLHTTKIHVHHMLEKLCAKTRTEAVATARRRGELL